jgi:hypothetical protein
MNNRRTIANRENAKGSTGPRTSHGKAKSRVNALRHGLATAIIDDPDFGPEVERLTGVFAGDRPSPTTIRLARAVAEAELEIVRARQSRTTLLDMIALDVETHFPAFSSAEMRSVEDALGSFPLHVNAAVEYRLPGPPRPELLAPAVRRTVDQLARLDRYERRATSRRRCALRQFLAFRYAGER